MGLIRRWLTPVSLRRRVTVAFALGGLAVSVLFASATYALTRGFLLDQRERTVLRQAFVDASVLRGQLSTAGTTPSQALATLDPQGAVAVLIHRDGEWFSSSLDVDAGAVPARVVAAAENGQVAYAPAVVLDTPSLVVGIPLPSEAAVVYEVRSQAEVSATLRTMAAVLGAGAAAAVLLAALFGARSSRRVLRPLDPLAGTAAAIASGQLSTRLPETTDPDLAVVVGSFNAMVDALQHRIERDSRFAADVSHEMRSPLTTLVGCVDLLQNRRDELSPAGRSALQLVEQELHRLRRLLEDLIDLARADPLAVAQTARTVDLEDLVRHVLVDRHLPPGLLHADAGPHPVHGDPRALARVVANLVDNGERHGRGLSALSLVRDGDQIELAVDDAGPGVPTADRERIFERFATLGAARGSTSSSGLGLALVRETAVAHGGSVRCTGRSGGGTRFVLRIPLAPVDSDVTVLP